MLWWISIIRPHKPENLLFLRAEVIYDRVLLVNLLAVIVFVVLADIS